MSSPLPEDTLLYEKAVAFTQTEVVTFEAWEDAFANNQPELAHRILVAGLLAEHYKSLLSEDPAQVTNAQSERLTFLLDSLRDELAKLSGITRRNYGG